jgi:antitoxin MazE
MNKRRVERTMVKKLSKHGNSLALVIDRSILDLLNIDEETSLEVSTDGEALIVAPVRDRKRRKKFEEALAASNERYGSALKRLAE